MTKNMIGKSVKRIDAWAKVLGKAKYTEDLIILKSSLNEVI